MHSVSRKGIETFVVLFTLILPGTVAWHDLGNADFHCWKLGAGASDPVPYSTCPGINIRWIEPPPETIKMEVDFNVTYEMTFEDNFWTWAVTDQGSFKPNFFASANTTGISDPAKAKQWCLTTTCPSDVKKATQDNCCIHHVNVHSCPLSEVSAVKNGLCGPWIKPTGSTFTHSSVLVGPGSQANWTSTVLGLHVEGKMSLIAHFKLVGMQVALEKTLTILPKTVCGDGTCELEENCETCPADCGRCPLKTWQVAIIVVAAVCILAAFAGVIGYFRYKQYKLFWDESWVIEYANIKPDVTVRGFMGSAVSIQTTATGATNLGGNKNQRFTQTGILDGRTVAMKEIHKKEFTLTRQIRREVKRVRELDHPNLCRFIGGCVEMPNVIIVTEYCPKGSLNDVLLNDEIPLNWGFRFSFASDAAKAMSYLHGNQICHGHLSSQNLIVDDRWTIKVSDYGLEIFRRVEIKDETMNSNLAPVYIAPEQRGLKNVSPTPEADVYSFAIILYEISSRNDPYGDDDPESAGANYKPPLPEYKDKSGEESTEKCPCPAELNQLIERCWSEKPSERPSFEIIKKTITRINPNKQSPVDMMISLMEKYSKHLEVLVAERTQDLEAEKIKTDRLLYSMLPKAIADELRRGETINAEWYDECTIYFSDIVGFTTISGGSTPLQVVAMLNKLYICFDTIIDSYDVYKVETIGDAYMVVSGVPQKNGNNHAKHVANMTVDLVNLCKTFQIPHMPTTPLKIRAGLHSGAVCAGVVGLKMPRYCLFGDTVNTASRMESNGEAYKIHISEATYKLLELIGGFRCTYRGTIPVKGKGDMNTYWLEDRA